MMPKTFFVFSPQPYEVGGGAITEGEKYEAGKETLSPYNSILTSPGGCSWSQGLSSTLQRSIWIQPGNIRNRNVQHVLQSRQLQGACTATRHGCLNSCHPSNPWHLLLCTQRIRLPNSPSSCFQILPRTLSPLFIGSWQDVALLTHVGIPAVMLFLELLCIPLPNNSHSKAKRICL